MDLSSICDLIILVAAVLVAITQIYNFFSKSGKGIRNKVNQVRTDSEKAEEEKIRTVLNKILPGILYNHDLEVRDKYKGDRQRYLQEIKEEVICAIRGRLEAVDTHEGQMEIFSEVLKELLRERIMTIYSRNRGRRELEEHEKIELERSYSAYKSINGNSYIDGYYERMKAWKVIPDDYN